MTTTSPRVDELLQELADLRAGFREATEEGAVLKQVNDQLWRANEALRQRLLDEMLFKAQLVDLIEGK